MHTADLEITVTLGPDAVWRVTIRLTPPGQPQATLVRDAPAALDLTTLQALSNSPEEYGRVLTKQLFSAEQVRQAWARARAYVDAQGEQLRVRLVLHPDDNELHGVRWEILREPDGDTPLALHEGILFSRCLDSADLKPIFIPMRPELRATVAVAAPVDLAMYNLAEVDVEGEVARAEAALDNTLTVVVGNHVKAQPEFKRATLHTIFRGVREASHILLLVCHGRQDGQGAWLYLEDETGKADPVSAESFLQSLGTLKTQDRPLLVVLVACRGAGSSHGPVLTALGPQLAQAGVAAVIAFQGDVALATVKTLLPRLFTELLTDGVVDRSLAVARHSLAHDERWQAVLWLRVPDGRLWRKDLDPTEDDEVGKRRGAGWFDHWRYRRRYLRHLFYQHRYLDLRGLPTQGPFNLLVEETFVELSLDEQPGKASPAPINAAAPALSERRHDVWAFLGAKDGRHLAIIGAPGTGKTTLLKKLALVLRNPRNQSLPPTVECKLPILLYLRECADILRADPGLMLPGILEEILKRRGEPSLPSSWFKAQLHAGGCLVMLDGLDEVGAADRVLIQIWVRRQIEYYGRNRFIITSRPHGFSDDTLGDVFAALKVCAFSREQVQRFVHNWYLANEGNRARQEHPDEGVRRIAHQGAQDLLGRIRRTPTLAELATNPLLLTMIATVHCYRGTLPGRRVELYAEICEAFLGKRHEARKVEQELKASQQQKVLELLAYEMMRQERHAIKLDEALTIIAEPLSRVNADLSGSDFLRLVEHGSGLLLEREQETYSFAHLTFQEYLAATYIRRHNREQDLVRYIEVAHWEETIKLYVAQGDGTHIIEACLQRAGQSIDVLILGIQCGEEAEQIHPSVREALSAMLKIGAESDDAQRRDTIVGALLSLRLRRMAWLSEQSYIDTSPITHAEYKLFLDASRRGGAYYQPDLWPGLCFPRSLGGTPVVGVRPADARAFCDWLTLWEARGSRYRLPTVAELYTVRSTDSANLGKPGAIGYWALMDNRHVLASVDPGGLKSETLLGQLRRRYEQDVATLEALSVADPLDASPNSSNVRAQALAFGRDFYSGPAQQPVDLVKLMEDAAGCFEAFKWALALVNAFGGTFNEASNIADDEGLHRFESLFSHASKQAIELANGLRQAKECNRVFADAEERARAISAALERANERVSAMKRDLRHRGKARLAVDCQRVFRRVCNENRAAVDRLEAELSKFNLGEARRRMLARILAHAWARVGAHEDASPRANALAIVSACVFPHPLAKESRSEGLVQACAAAIDKLTAACSWLDLDQVLELARSLDPARALELSADADWEGKLARAFADALRGDPSLTLAEALTTALNRALKSDAPQTDAIDSARQYARLCALALALQLTKCAPKRRDQKGDPDGPASYLSLYLHLALLEERVSGAWPAVEGIWLVKE